MNGKQEKSRKEKDQEDNREEQQWDEDIFSSGQFEFPGSVQYQLRHSWIISSWENISFLEPENPANNAPDDNQSSKPLEKGHSEASNDSGVNELTVKPLISAQHYVQKPTSSSPTNTNLPYSCQHMQQQICKPKGSGDFIYQQTSIPIEPSPSLGQSLPHKQHFDQSHVSFDSLQNVLVHSASVDASAKKQEATNPTAALSVRDSSQAQNTSISRSHSLPDYLHDCVQEVMEKDNPASLRHQSFDCATLPQLHQSERECSSMLPKPLLGHQMPTFDVLSTLPQIRHLNDTSRATSPPMHSSVSRVMPAAHNELNVIDSTSTHVANSESFNLSSKSEPPVSFVSSWMSLDLTSKIPLAQNEKTKEWDAVAAKTARVAPPSRRDYLPSKLHRLLTETQLAGQNNIVSWTASGTAFRVHNTKVFAKDIAPKYFRTKDFQSFLRNLRIYGFDRIFCGPDIGSYMHPLFLRDQPELCEQIVRSPQNTGRGSSNKASDDELENVTNKTSKRAKKQEKNAL